MVIPGEATPPGESVTPAIPDVDGRRSSCELILLPTLSPPILSLSLGDCFFVKGRERGRGSLGGIRSTGDRSSGISPFSAMTSSPGSSAWSPSGGESPTEHPPPLLPFSPTLSPFCALEKNRKWNYTSEMVSIVGERKWEGQLHLCVACKHPQVPYEVHSVYAGKGQSVSYIYI